jgi:CheY-like chemotaxis protein
VVYVKRILIADDHAAVRAALRKSLNVCSDWRVFEAENGREAVTKAQELLPNLIVLDMSMPVMNGLEAGRELRRLMPAVPLLLWTSLEGEHVTREALAGGFDHVFFKSEGASPLLQKIQELLLEGLEA